MGARTKRWFVDDVSLVLPEYVVQYELVQSESQSLRGGGGGLGLGASGNDLRGSSRLAATSTFELPTIPTGIASSFDRLLQLFMQKCKCQHAAMVSQHCLPSERLLDHARELLQDQQQVATVEGKGDPGSSSGGGESDLTKPVYTIHDSSSGGSESAAGGGADGGGRSSPDANGSRSGDVPLASPEEVLSLLREQLDAIATSGGGGIGGVSPGDSSDHHGDGDSAVAAANESDGSGAAPTALSAAAAATITSGGSGGSGSNNSNNSPGAAAAAAAKAATAMFLVDRGLRSLPVFSFAGPSLVLLDLSFNALRRLPRGAFAPLTGLRELRLDFNFLESLSALEAQAPGLRAVETLSLICNRLRGVAAVESVGRACPRLQRLCLQDNPVCKQRGYLGQVMRRVPQLTRLDDVVVDAQMVHRDEAAKIRRLIRQRGVTAGGGGGGDGGSSGSGNGSGDADGLAASSSALSAAALSADYTLRSVRVPYGRDHGGPAGSASSQSSSSSSSSSVAVSPTVASGASSSSSAVVAATASPDELDALIDSELAAAAAAAAGRPATATAALARSSSSSSSSSGVGGGGGFFFFESVVRLDLSERGISTIQCMQLLPALQQLNLSGNEIEVITGLEQCVQLRDLNLSNNCLEAVQGLDRCQHLRVLDLSGNMLTSFAGLGALSKLEQLSVQDNRVARLDGLGELEALVELYLANNAVASLREVQKLKQLSGLIILDLVGNAAVADCVPADDYRPYCIFHLPQLKVLDGCGITSAEYYAAKDKFAGKVTVDFLAEIVGHDDFPSIYELDLNGCRIRALERLRGHGLVNLVDLDLSNNGLASIAGLAGLEQLTVLRLGNNKLSSPVIGSNNSAQAAAARAAAARQLMGLAGGFTELRLCALEVSE
jgi:Leucine-rich repeat (LRR) protein